MELMQAKQAQKLGFMGVLGRKKQMFGQKGKLSIVTFENMSKVAPCEAANALISESLPVNNNF